MEKKDADLDFLSDLLKKTSIPSDSGLSFAGRSLFKKNELEDAKEVVEEIKKCENLHYINLEGNSLGVAAAEEISKALMTRSEFKKAIWKDMFTGRLKTEIPEALKFLGKALITANANLEVLDLSDNASGPIGVDGFRELLTSPVCYTLKELKLNNMGLGITGGKMLASALMECYNKSKENGTPLRLKVFIAGRNRLENEGATALAAVFKALKSLEVVSMPQNGIYAKGIKALSSAFSENKNLQQIDLNDNTVSPVGAKVMSDILGELKLLTTLDLGDCLLKSEGVGYMIDKLSTLPKLEVLNLSFNEINYEVGLQLVRALISHPTLKKLCINGNQFGIHGCDTIKMTMKSFKKYEVLDSLCDDEGEAEDEEGEEESLDEEDETDGEEDDLDDGESDDQTPDEDSETESSGDEPVQLQSGVSPMHRTQVTAAMFLEQPTASNLVSLRPQAAESIIEELKEKPDKMQLDHMIVAIMKVSSLTIDTNKDARNVAIECTETLYRELFAIAEQRNTMAHINNTLPVYLGLIKNEEKSNMKKKYNHDGCINAVRNAMKKKIMPHDIHNILEMFLKQDHPMMN